MTKIMKSIPLSILWIAIALIHSGHAFRTLSVNLTRSIYIAALAALIYFVYVLTSKKMKFGTEDFIFIVSFFMVGSSYLMDGFQAGGFYRITLAEILFAYFIIKLYSFRHVMKLYMIIMTVTSAIALVGYFLANYTNLLEFLPVYKNSNGVEYVVGIVFNYIKAIPERNCGMFWEPGLFATHLVIAIVIELISKKKASFLKLLLFSVCLFTANSSAGFVLWFLCLILYFVRSSDRGKGKYFGSFFVIGILVIALIVLLNLDYIIMNTGLKDNEYFQKLLLDNILDSSRVNAIIHNLKSFATAPLFGVGYVHSMDNIKFVADTSTSTYLLSAFGVLGAFYTIAIIYGILRQKNVGIISKILILIIALLIVNKEPHLQNVFTWILIFYLVGGASQNDLYDKEERKAR
ncbi:MAG: hypothetical protein J6K14_00110 [Clostridia bacterium]|nr:hypothetical protein [Clostridia bacterium]